jgi:hypothetical protein
MNRLISAAIASGLVCLAVQVPTAAEKTYKVPAGTATGREIGPATGGVVGPVKDPTTSVYATTSIKCGKTVYEVSTGSNSGKCTPSKNPKTGARDIVVCEDNAGNKSAASCALGCGNTEGSGSCTVKMQ